MGSASMSFGRPVRITFPRGSTWFASLAAWLIRRLGLAGAASDAAWPAVDDNTPLPRCRAWISRE